MRKAQLGKRASAETRKNMSVAQKKVKKKPLSEETKRKIGLANSVSLKGRIVPEETKKKISLALKGRPSDKKGKPISEEHRQKVIKALIGHPVSEETRKKIGNANRGKVGWLKGKHRSDKTKLKISNSRKGMVFTEDHKANISLGQMGKVAWNKGLSAETDERVRKYGESIKGEKHPNWEGGKSFEPYGTDFDEKLRRKIRARDNHTCQECDFTEEQLGRRLSVHHIDYNKKNNNSENLVSLCKSCHGQTNFKRKDWTKYLKKKVENA